jgi:hypothetical protein
MTQPRFLQVLAAVLVALVLATTFTHVLELPAKLAYSASLYVELQKSLYQQWGPPNPAGFLEPAAIIVVVILAMTTRRNRPAFRLAVGAALVLLVAFPLLYFWRVEPANEYFRTVLTGTTIPAGLGVLASSLGNRPDRAVHRPSHRVCPAHRLDDAVGPEASHQHALAGRVATGNVSLHTAHGLRLTAYGLRLTASIESASRRSCDMTANGAS